MGKSFLTEYRLELGSLLGLLFGFLTIVAIVGAYEYHLANKSPPETLPGYLDPLGGLAEPFGKWVYWLVVIAPIGLIVAVWWLYDYRKKTRELSSLIDTPSKAKFVRNLDDIEYLAWSLPQRFEDQVLDKKKEFKL